MKKIWIAVSLGLTMAAVIEWAWIKADTPARHNSFVSMTGAWVKAPQPVPLPEFQLVSDHDRPFRLQDLRGGWHLLVFGYTSCRDACPTALSILAATLKDMRTQPPALVPQVVFISVDPDRDTPEHLAAYVTHFHEDFKGVTGTAEQLKKLIHGLGSDYQIERQHGVEQVNHPTSLFLIDPEGRLTGQFSHPTLPAKLSAEIKVALRPERAQEPFAP